MQLSNIKSENLTNKDLSELYLRTGSASQLINIQLDKYLTDTQKEFLSQLNLKVFNLFLYANFLQDNSLSGKTNRLTAISSNNFVVAGEPLDSNTSNLLPQILTLSAKEITGNDNANANTPLQGVYGTLEINGKKITIGNAAADTKDTTGYYDSLNSIKRKINGITNSGAYAEVVNNDTLIISSTNEQQLNITDKTYGGENDKGLGLKLPAVFSESEVFSRFYPPGFLSAGVPVKSSQVTKFSSNDIRDITGKTDANSSTVLYGLQGNFTVNNYQIPVNSAGILDNFSSLATRINSLNIGVTASVENNKLVLQSNDYNTEVEVVDNTTGGSVNGLGISRSGYSSDENTLSASYLYEDNITVFSSAQKQLNQSYGAKEITNNSSADENTALNLSGTLKINSATIILQPSQNLKDIKSLINTLADGVKAEIVNGQLFLQATDGVAFNLTDNSTGGEKNGLGIGTLPLTTESLSLNVILAKTEVNENTFLEGISGTLRINGKDIAIGLTGSTDTLARIKDSINVVANIGVTVSIENNKLVLTSSNGNNIQITDLTTGGYASDNGALGIKTSDSTIARPQKAVIQTGDKILSLNENISPDGVSGFKLNILSSSIYSLNQFFTTTAQITSTDNITNIESHINKVINSYNDIINFTKEKITLNRDNKNSGEYFSNQSLNNFLNNLREIFKQEKKSTDLKLKDLGIETFSNLPDAKYLINKDKLQQSIKNNLQQTLNIFNDNEKGISTQISKLLKGFTLNDGVPGVDVRESSLYTLFKESYDAFSSVNFSSLFDLSNEGLVVNVMQ